MCLDKSQRDRVSGVLLLPASAITTVLLKADFIWWSTCAATAHGSR